jgi:hypothetical protein
LKLLQVLASSKTRTGSSSSCLLSLLCLLGSTKQTSLPLKHQLTLKRIMACQLLGSCSSARKTSSLLTHQV